jgi:excinuclease UvrABC ATPase subunit
MYQFSTNAESINAMLSSDRVIDMDPEGGEGEGVIVVANMPGKSNALYTSANIMDLEDTGVCPG